MKSRSCSRSPSSSYFLFPSGFDPLSPGSLPAWSSGGARFGQAGPGRVEGCPPSAICIPIPVPVPVPRSWFPALCRALSTCQLSNSNGQQLRTDMIGRQSFWEYVPLSLLLLFPSLPSSPFYFFASRFSSSLESEIVQYIYNYYNNPIWAIFGFFIIIIIIGFFMFFENFSLSFSLLKLT